MFVDIYRNPKWDMDYTPIRFQRNGLTLGNRCNTLTFIDATGRPLD